MISSPIKGVTLMTRPFHASPTNISRHKFITMPEIDSNSPGGLGGNYMDDDDDLCDYDVEIPDIDTILKAGENKKDTLGIDEEVKIRKRRIVVKLDEARYISSVLAS